MSKKLEELTTDWMDKAYPTKNLTIKSTDQPWITFEIKKAIKDRKKIFKKDEKRTERWKTAKKNTDSLILESKKRYITKNVRSLP